jgi:hypothetical protein
MTLHSKESGGKIISVTEFPCLPGRPRRATAVPPAARPGRKVEVASRESGSITRRGATSAGKTRRPGIAPRRRGRYPGDPGGLRSRAPGASIRRPRRPYRRREGAARCWGRARVVPPAEDLNCGTPVADMRSTPNSGSSRRPQPQASSARAAESPPADAPLPSRGWEMDRLPRGGPGLSTAPGTSRRGEREPTPRTPAGDAHDAAGLLLIQDD